MFVYSEVLSRSTVFSGTYRQEKKSVHRIAVSNEQNQKVLVMFAACPARWLLLYINMLHILLLGFL